MNPAPLTILYVEDEENDVYLLHRAFTKAALPVSIEICSDGEQARRWLAGHDGEAPDLLILDLNLPLLTGFELLAWWRQHAPGASTPVVIVTSSDNEHDKQRAAELGAAAYLLKPTSPAGYAALVAQLYEVAARHGVAR